MEQKKYLDLDGLKHYNDKLKTLIDNSTANNVIVKGNVDNSAILKGEYQGYKNIALSQTSAAIGAAVKAGLKGWYYNHVNVGEKKIFLTSKQSTTISNTSLIYPDKNFINDTFECGYNVGDTISIVFNKKYENYTTITSISGNVITLSEIPFTTDDFTLGTAKVVATTPDEFSFYSVKREVNSTTNEVTVTNYDKGDVDLGGGAHAEGANSTAANIAAHAEGIQTLADGQAAHAEGIMTQAVYAAHAEGFKTVASGHNSHAEGNQTIASGQDAHAEGKEAVASGIQSHAEGQWTQAQGSQSHAEGENSVAKGNQSHAEGYSTLSEGVNSHSEGESTQALGKDSHAEGFQTVAKGTYTHAEGYNAVAYGNYSHAEGFSSLKLEDIDAKSGETYEEKWDSLENAEKFNMAFGKQSHVEGNGNIAVGDRGHAEGIFTKALGTNSHAEGQQTISEGIASHAEGFNTHAKGKGSHTSGIGTITNNDGEFACGQYNDSIVDQTIFSIGNGTNIGDIIERSNIFEITKDKILFKGENINVIKKYNDSGIILIDTNNTNIATGVDSFAMGRGSTSSAPYAVSMGTGSIAAGNYSFAGGTGSETTGSGSFAFGGQCKALQNRAVAMGYQCESNGFQSFAMGRGIKTTNNDEFSCGKYNYSDPSKNTLFSVGHGTSDTRRRNLIEANNTDDGFGKVIIQSQNESPSTDGSCSIEVERNGVKISVVDGDGEYGSDTSSIEVNSDSIKLKQSSPGDYIKNNILELNSSGLYYNDENILHNITPILYEELKNLRDNSKLIPGRWYRITDYQCYTSQENTRSANHPFDILVMALSENILSEDARAMMRDGDTYYEHANITTWKLRYVLDDPEQKYYWGIVTEGEQIPIINNFLYDSSNCSIKSELITDNTFNEPVPIKYILTIDAENNEFYDSGKIEGDLFIEWGYELEQRMDVPSLCIYKTDISGLGDEPDPEFAYADTQDKFFYRGKEEVEGVIYDKWQKIETGNGIRENLENYDNSTIVFILTPEIVNGEVQITELPTFEIKSEITIQIDGEHIDNNYPTQFTFFAGSKRLDNNDEQCLVIYPNVQMSDGEITSYASLLDYENPFFYCGQEEVDGVVYDKWRKINTDLTWDQDWQMYTLTPVIVEDGEISMDLVQAIMDVNFPSGYSGVIYQMIDDRGNECPYDFKNIQYLLDDGNWYFTFDHEGSDDSVRNYRDYNKDEEEFLEVTGCHDNVIKPWLDAETIKYSLNRIIFRVSSHCYNNTFGYNCYNNTFEEDCNENTFGALCFSNTFGIRCRINTFEEGCSHNTFGMSCEGNTFEESCSYNTFGISCDDNTFKTGCGHNTFGDYCRYNTFGISCDDNTFGDRCEDNTFGTSCWLNTFGDYCYSNTFGVDFEENTFGNECYSNTFGNECYSNTFGNECYSNTFGDRCRINTFGALCFSNTFGNECYSNTFESSCSSNTFGVACNNNTFGKSYRNNIFGDGCYSNTFGNECYSNTFGVACNNNTFGKSYCNNIFGDGCYSNTFGNECYSNTFGNSCRYNTFESSCSSNTFGNECSSIIFGVDCDNNTFGDVCYSMDFIALQSISQSKFSSGTKYINFDVGENVSTTAVRNIFVGPGIYGSSNNRLAIDIEVSDNDYEWKIMKNSKGEIKQYCEADLIF